MRLDLNKKVVGLAATVIGAILTLAISQFVNWVNNISDRVGTMEKDMSKWELMADHEKEIRELIIETEVHKRLIDTLIAKHTVSELGAKTHNVKAMPEPIIPESVEPAVRPKKGSPKEDININRRKPLPKITPHDLRKQYEQYNKLRKK